MRGSMDLVQLIRLLLKRLWIIILVTIMGFLVAFSYTKLFVTPKYTSAIKLYVSNSKVIEPIEKLNYNDIYAAQQLVNTYVVIIQSNKVLNQVIATENLQCSAEYLKSLLNIKAVGDTEIMEVMVTTESPQLSADIANAIGNIAPDLIKDITKAGAAEVVDRALPRLNPSSPNIVINSAIGILFGAFISILFTILYEIFDTRIKGEDDIRRHYNIPVLGSIPVLHSKMKGGYIYYEY